MFICGGKKKITTYALTNILQLKKKIEEKSSFSYYANLQIFLVSYFQDTYPLLAYY